MNTIVLHIKDDQQHKYYQEAAKKLLDGGLVAFPTETVYGIGANALVPEVVKKIYAAKGRPSDNPLIVHIGNANELEKYVSEIPEHAYPLMDAFWPGALTMIFKKNDCIPDLITGGLKTVAIRVPSHPVARKIIETSGLPIAAPSANISGKPSPTTAKHVIEDLSGRVDMIVDGGDANIGLESTVLDLTGERPMILRPGGVTKAMIEAVIGPIDVDAHMLSLEKKEVPKSPGMKYRHYAPKGHLKVFSGHSDHVIQHINKLVQEAKEAKLITGVIATQEEAHLYDADHIRVIGSMKKPEEIAANLFKVLRDMDDLGVEAIFSTSFDETDIGVATMNRLLKASGNQKIEIGD